MVPQWFLDKPKEGVLGGSLAESCLLTDQCPRRAIPARATGTKISSIIQGWLTTSHFWRSQARKTVQGRKHLLSIVLKSWTDQGERAPKSFSHMEEWRLSSTEGKILNRRPASRFIDS